MKDSTLIWSAFICSLIGIIVLYFVADVREISPSSIANLEEEQEARIIGEVAEITSKEGFSFVDIVQENKVTVVVFGELGEGLKTGDKVEVTGKVEDYKGEKEIVADKIEKVE